MKLHWSPRSPFVRKVMIVAHELGIADRIGTMRVIVDPANPNPEVTQFNPVGKIPTLILDDGTVLFDSVVIVEYLDATYGGSLIPRGGPERWKALALQALADGVMELDVRWLEERNKPPTERREAIIAGAKARIAMALDRCEADPPADLTVGSIALASALAHLDFRFPEEPWRHGRPKLAAWFDVFAARPSMAATAFVNQY